MIERDFKAMKLFAAAKLETGGGAA